MRLAIISVGVMVLVSCSTESSCRNEPRARSLSPNGKMAAVVFSRNCGATVGDNYQVSIIPTSEQPEGKGNALVLDQAPDYTPNLKPAWSGNSAVTIPIPSGARMFSKKVHVNGVMVMFQQLYGSNPAIPAIPGTHKNSGDTENSGDTNSGDTIPN